MRGSREAIIDILTVAIGAVALAVALITLLSRHQSENLIIEEQDRQVSGWREFAKAGQLTGPADAPVTIIVFGEYECSGCRSLRPVLEKVMDRWPKEVEMVYRHFPLPYHRYAYTAASAAQCAANQGRFWGFHGRLFEEETRLGNSFLRFAEEVGVPNVERFENCV